MAAPIKEGLDYFPYDIGLLKDRKLRRPKIKYGYLAIVVYLSLLEMIYGEHGYYIEYNAKTQDDIIWEILENLQGKHQPEAETIAEVIDYLVACELFSGDQFKEQILTSKRIQLTYYKAVVERKMVLVDFSKWLLSIEEMQGASAKCIILQNFLNRPINVVNRPINSVNRPINPQSKVKESKVKESRVEREGNGAKAPTHSRFTPPSLDEVEEYCKERKNSINAKRFIDYYTSKGWKVGNSTMRDWKASVRTWEGRETKGNKPQQPSADNERKYTESELNALFGDISNPNEWGVEVTHDR